MSDRRSKGSSDCLGVKLGRFWRFGGFPNGFGSHPSKNLNHFLSLLLPSLPGLTLHHNICFLSPLSLPPPLTFSHLCPSDSEPYSVLKFHIYHCNGNKSLIKEQQQRQTCSDLAEMTAHMGKRALLPDVTGYYEA